MTPLSDQVRAMVEAASVVVQEFAQGHPLIKNLTSALASIDLDQIIAAVGRWDAPSAAEDCLRTAKELRDNSNGDCNAIMQAIMWEERATALRQQEQKP